MEANNCSVLLVLAKGSMAITKDIMKGSGIRTIKIVQKVGHLCCLQSTWVQFLIPHKEPSAQSQE